jgi:hypothetical protein
MVIKAHRMSGSRLNLFAVSFAKKINENFSFAATDNDGNYNR